MLYHLTAPPCINELAINTVLIAIISVEAEADVVLLEV
jgi:hypothetical protein